MRQLIAYTLGETKAYDQVLIEKPGAKKLGRYAPTPEEPEGYAGGIAFRTVEEARPSRSRRSDVDH